MSTFHLLCVGALSEGSDDDVVGAMATTVSGSGIADRVDSALLFDGHRFAQLMEGAEADVRSSMARIVGDERLQGVTVLACGDYELRALVNHRQSARCSGTVMDTIASQPLPEDEVALAVFMSALTQAQET